MKNVPTLYLKGANYRPFPQWKIIRYRNINAHYPVDIECKECGLRLYNQGDTGAPCPNVEDGNHAE